MDYLSSQKPFNQLALIQGSLIPTQISSDYTLLALSKSMPCKDHLHYIVTAPVTSVFVVIHLSPASYSSIGTVKTTRMATVIWSPICR